MVKLFSVRIITHAVVVADDESHAYSVARDHRIDAVADGNPEYDVEGGVACIEQLPRDWDGRCMPYGGDGKTTIEVLLEAERVKP